MARRCDPVVMRKNLEVVSALKAYGIDFVCMPVRNQVEKAKYLIESERQLDIMISEGSVSEKEN